MHSAFEKVMCFFDKHHKGVFYLTVFFTVLSSVLYTFFHTKEYGYDSTIADNLPSALIDIILLIMISKLNNIGEDKLEKRTATYFYLLVLFTSVIMTFGEMYIFFVKDISFITAVSLYLPLFIGLIVLLYKTRNYYKEFARKTSMDVKAYIKMFIDMFKI